MQRKGNASWHFDVHLGGGATRTVAFAVVAVVLLLVGGEYLVGALLALVGKLYGLS